MSTVSEATKNILAGDNTLVHGTDFTPAIAGNPKVISVIDSNNVDISASFKKSYFQNGDNYDLLIFSSDAVNNAKIYVIW
jgi:hypothetical protein